MSFFLTQTAHWSIYLSRIYSTIKYYVFWIYSFVKICRRRKKHLNIILGMYVIIYCNVATKNSLPKRLLQFTKLEYMSARFIICYRKNVQSFDRKISFSHPALAIIRPMTMASDIFSGTYNFSRNFENSTRGKFSRCANFDVP